MRDVLLFHLPHAVVGEERIVLQPNALEDPAVKELTNVCT